jgi:uncharacterized protein (TIGR03086 family)
MPVEDHLFHRALHMVDAVMRQVVPEDMDKPTPCTEWDVRALANHITYEVAWVEPLLQGKTINEVGKSLDGDLLGDKPLESWHEFMVAAMNATNMASPDAVVHLSYADKSAQAYLDEVGGDIIIHGWDLAKGINTNFLIDDDTCRAVTSSTNDVMPLGRDSGLVAEALVVNESASAMEKLLASYGRDINWSK